MSGGREGLIVRGLAAVFALGLCILPVALGGSSARAAAPGSTFRDTYRFVFTGSLKSVATAPSGGGAATDVWTTNLRWRLIYRAEFISLRLGSHTLVAVHPGGLCRYVNGPGSFVCALAPGSSLSGSSVGVQNPGGPSVSPDCLHIGLSLRERPAPEGWFTPFSSSLSASLLWFGAPTTPGFDGIVYPPGCPAPIEGAPTCSPALKRSPVRPTLTQYGGPVVLISRPRQAWAVSGTCVGDGGGNSPVDANYAQNAHWNGELTATRLSHIKIG